MRVGKTKEKQNVNGWFAFYNNLNCLHSSSNLIFLYSLFSARIYEAAQRMKADVQGSRIACLRETHCSDYLREQRLHYFEVWGVVDFAGYHMISSSSFLASSSSSSSSSSSKSSSFLPYFLPSFFLP